MGKLLIPSIYRHDQTEASTEWTIVHNLGGANGEAIPVVDVFITSGGVLQKIIPAATIIADRNTVIVRFSGAHAGEAVVIV